MEESGSGTIRLYRDDPFLDTFTAKVLDVSELEEESWAVVLDRTAFYPEGGGQPPDEGRLGDVEVVNVQEEVGVVLHFTDGPLEVGSEVEGSIDWGRRWDIMQQHTGQHLLSAVLFHEFEAATKGFHLGLDESTIDLSRELSPEELLLVQARVNNLIDADIPVTATIVDREHPSVEAARRPPPPDVEAVRIIGIEGLDSVPCGGTHLPSTLKIGGLHILAGPTRKVHGLFRITFICGGRLRRRLIELDRVAAELSRLLTTGPESFVDRFDDLQQQNRDLMHEIAEMQRALIPLRVSALIDSAEAVGPARIVLARVDDLPPEILPKLASTLTENGDVVALLGADVEGTGRLVFARGDSLELDMGSLLKESAALLGGGGGGDASHATGGGPKGDALDTALTEALEQIRSELG